MVKDRRKVWKSGGGEASSNVVGIIAPPVEIELTDMSKSGVAIVPPAPPAPLYSDSPDYGYASHNLLLERLTSLIYLFAVCTIFFFLQAEIG